ncbi:MAG TPA: hypothetical protein VH703_02675 [Solirubrobacterales bacterium]|jgi:hypothetical protein
MIRNLWTLGLALIGALSINASAVSTASANVNHHFDASSEAVQLKGNNSEGTQVIKFTSSSSEEVRCDMKITGTLEKTNSQLTVEPTYSNCKIYLNGEDTGLTPAFEINECQYLFGGETTKGSPLGGEHGLLSITCPEKEEEKQEILTTVTAFKFKCKGIPSQGAHGLHYSNIEKGGVKGVRIELTVQGLHMNTLGGPDCDSGEHSDGSFAGSIDAWAYNEAEELVDFWLKEEAT